MLARLRPGGLIAVDNVLARRRGASPTTPTTSRAEQVEAIRAHQRADRRRRAGRLAMVGDRRRDHARAQAMSAIDRECARAAAARASGDWIAMLGASSPGAQPARARRGESRRSCPACPQRSICNSVSYDGRRRARAPRSTARRRLRRGRGRRVDRLGPRVRRARRSPLLEAAGHVLDGTPDGDVDRARRLRAARRRRPRLGRRRRPRRARAAQRRSPTASPTMPGSRRGSARRRPDDLRLYQARVDGEPACVLGTIDHDRDLGFYFVATAPGPSRPRASPAA